MKMENMWVIVVTGADGTVSVVGTSSGRAFSLEYRATLRANDIESVEGVESANVHIVSRSED
jgi:hypothetical protein